MSAPSDATPRTQRETAAERLAELEEVEVVVEKLVLGGDGMARYEGIPLFVPRSVPGDRVRVKIVERRPDFGRAEIVEVLEPGAGRRQPPCPYFGDCGGCDLQQIDDELQPRLKAAATVETLRRLGRLSLPEPELVTGEAWGYRLRTQLHAAAGDPVAAVGYHARGSRDIVAVDSCPILVPALEAALPELPAALGAEPPRRLDLAAGADGAFTTAPVVEGLPRGAVELSVAGFTLRYDARCFFQGHAGLLETLVERAVGPWEGATAFDLYAGVGLFSLPLARRYRNVVAVESDSVAVRYGRMNSRRNGVRGLRFDSRRVEGVLERLPEGADRIVVDPPRAGLPKPARRLLAKRPAARLTYVSCHPATLARDLRVLLERYEVESWTLLDLFPQTGHMEAVVQLVKAS